MTEQVDDFLRSGLDYIYGDQYEDFAEGFGARAVIAGVGILVTCDEDVIKISARVFSGRLLNDSLTARIADVCIGTRIGSFYLSPEPSGSTGSLIYAAKIPRSWIDPSSQASAQMLAEILTNAPELVNSRAGYIASDADVTYARWPTDAGTWWFTLMDHC
jgi:hypothetical protein